MALNIAETNPLPGTSRIAGNLLGKGDQIQVWDELHKIHSVAEGDRHAEIRVTLEGRRGGAGWTLILRAGVTYIAKKKAEPFEPDTVIVMGEQSFLRGRSTWLSKNGTSVFSDSGMRDAVKNGEAKIIFEPAKAVDDDFGLSF